MFPRGIINIFLFDTGVEVSKRYVVLHQCGHKQSYFSQVRAEKFCGRCVTKFNLDPLNFQPRPPRPPEPPKPEKKTKDQELLELLRELSPEARDTLAKVLKIMKRKK